MIAIIDLGVGNLSNVRKAFNGIITRDPYKIEKAEKIVLPGVGNFSVASKALSSISKVIVDAVNEGKPILGICLGYQLLFEESEEGNGQGLCLLKGKVLRLSKAPHIGWNRVFIKKECKLFEDIENGSFFYFVHSYAPLPEDVSIVTGVTYVNENLSFVSAICKDNIYGVQFHPEKSSKLGLKLINNFRRL